MMLAVLVLLQESPVERYLLEKDKAARARILSEIRSPLSSVEEELRRAPPRPPAADRGQVVRRTLKADHPLGPEFDTFLFVPREYDSRKRSRLIISLHGQSGSGETFLHHWLPDVEASGDTFLLCPSAGRGGWGSSLLGYSYILSSLRDALARYAIDPDQVFIDGASMGGNGSFQFACTFPDLFAGAAPRAGGPLFRYRLSGPDKKDRTLTVEGLENLVATPLYWVVGLKDPELPSDFIKLARKQIEALKLDCVLREFPEGGHEWFPRENASVLEWMRGKHRNPYPPRVAVWSREKIFNRSFWLEVTEPKGKEITRGFADLEKKQIEERPIYPEPYFVQAELRADANEVKINATGVRELRIYLHDRMLDLAKPVTVVVNGSRSTHTAKPSLETLLESARRDRGLLYTAALRVSVP
jgi:pimeloyl-ACP methyl ester carboxylesterase